MDINFWEEDIKFSVKTNVCVYTVDFLSFQWSYWVKQKYQELKQDIRPQHQSLYKNGNRQKQKF